MSDVADRMKAIMEETDLSEEDFKKINEKKSKEKELEEARAKIREIEPRFKINKKLPFEPGTKFEADGMTFTVVEVRSENDMFMKKIILTVTLEAFEDDYLYASAATFASLPIK